MTTVAHVVHRVPGRCRLRLPYMRGDVGFFRRLQSELVSELEGSEVSVNAATGSILFTGSPPSTDRLRQLARERDWFDIVREVQPSGDGNERSALLFDLSSDDLQQLMIAMFTALAVVQVLRGQIMVPATSFMMYALAANALSDHVS